MSEAVAFAAPISRVRTDDLPPLALSHRAEREAIEELSPRPYLAWRRLLLHLHKYGQLPTGFKALAAICKVGPRAFAAMEPLLALHMDIDGDGRWSHSDVLASRGGLPIRPAIELDGERNDGERNDVDPHLRAVRQAAARRSHENRRLKLVTTETSDANTRAKVGDGACKTELQNGDGFAGRVEAHFASASPGLFVGSSSDSFEKTNERTDRAEAGVREDANASCKTADDALANGACKIEGPSAPDRSLGEVDEGALIAALRAAAPKIPTPLFNRSDLMPLLTLVAEGCELERDVVPAVAAFVATLKHPLRGFGAGPIREKAIGSRNLALATRAEPQKTAWTELDCFVIDGSPPWRAWLRAKGVKSHFAFEKQGDRTKRGCYFESEWPPGWDAARLSASEAPGKT